MESTSQSLPDVLGDTQVLCVDDESMIGELVTKILRRHLACEVTTVRNGREGLALLEEHRFDIVIIDYLMPSMDGGELFRRIREEHPEMVSRILFITGDILSESTLDHIASTGQPLVEKPFGLPELMVGIRRILEQVGVASE